ncbi:MAG: dioxygenase [Bacteroidia bacterium]|nr:dioxygenase [Bacteroidia bacterium]
MPDTHSSAANGFAPAIRTPVLFIGHGSPMNAITDSAYSEALIRLGTELPQPKAVLVISAHWITSGTRVTSTVRNTQLFDFAGFPDELSRIKYTPPGDIALAERICDMLAPQATCDQFRPIDHGCWTVLSRMYPDAEIPVLQLSLDAKAAVHAHVALGARLSPLRERGVLIVASGNLCHALGALQPEPEAPPPRWVTDFDAAVADAIESDKQEVLTAYERLPFAERAIPESSHYLPLLYILGLRRPDDDLRWIYSEFEHGSVSMRSFLLAG